MADLEMLFKQLALVKGKFILSYYLNELISQYSSQKGWFQKEFKMPICASVKSVRSTKVEVLTANFWI